MNSWTQPQQTYTNNIVGQAQFSPYIGYNWNVQPKAPVYHAEPIHGANAAWQFPMAPGSEIYLPDADEDIIWWIRTDQNGIRTVQPFDVVLHEEPKPVDTQDLAARLAAVEEWINGKQNKSNAKRSNNAPTTTTSVQSGD